MIKYENVSFRYRNEPVLRRINLAVNGGEIVTILGENGSGKSTLLKLGCDLLEPTEGDITVYAPRLSYLPQSLQFPGKLTVSDLLDFYDELESKQRDPTIKRLLQIEDVETRRFRTLSGGQQRRVGLYLALGKPADLYCLDEPFAGLSPELVTSLTEYLHQSPSAVLFSSHLWERAVSISDRAFQLQEGLLSAPSKPEEILP
ncbi:MAG: ATP-binding cassette domain-containing protein [bacterium]